MKQAEKTILLVEDDAVLRPLLIELLEEMNYKIIAAADGNTGIAALNSLKENAQEISLLVTDIGLPGVNGKILAEQARSLWPTLPVLFITGYAHGFVDNLPLGVDVQILKKPFTLQALATKVSELVARRVE